MQEKKLRIAIIGAGVSGLTIGYMLNKKHDITIYEKNNYVGGHVNTIDVIDEKRNLSIDTGFIVFNDKTYPNFIDLLNKIGQESQKSVMSFSVSNKLKNLEYVKEFYGYNNEKAKAALDILNDEQISAIKTRLNKGGRNGRS